MSSVLAPYAEACEPCRDALAGTNLGRFDSGCMGCTGRDLARMPVIASQRGRAKVLKDRLLAADFDAAMAAREAWLEHDARRAAT
ncbi:MAG: hypothetical protein KF822_09355 [Steroidobacteraceae bacterium]|nr:hypothetical protein [Steroidobacteraceae bacterium]